MRAMSGFAVLAFKVCIDWGLYLLCHWPEKVCCAISLGTCMFVVPLVCSGGCPIGLL